MNMLILPLASLLGPEMPFPTNAPLPMRVVPTPEMPISRLPIGSTPFNNPLTNFRGAIRLPFGVAPTAAAEPLAESLLAPLGEAILVGGLIVGASFLIYYFIDSLKDAELLKERFDNCNTCLDGGLHPTDLDAGLPPPTTLQDPSSPEPLALPSDQTDPIPLPVGDPQPQAKLNDPETSSPLPLGDNQNQEKVDFVAHITPPVDALPPEIEDDLNFLIRECEDLINADKISLEALVGFFETLHETAQHLASLTIKALENKLSESTLKILGERFTEYLEELNAIIDWALEQLPPHLSREEKEIFADMVTSLRTYLTQLTLIPDYLENPFELTPEIMSNLHRFLNPIVLPFGSISVSVSRAHREIAQALITVLEKFIIPQTMQRAPNNRHQIEMEITQLPQEEYYQLISVFSSILGWHLYWHPLTSHLVIDLGKI